MRMAPEAYNENSRIPPVVVLLGPSRAAVSGVSTHLNQLFGSRLGISVTLRHFQVGSEGRTKPTWGGVVWRLIASPIALAQILKANHYGIVHINTSLNAKSFWRDLLYLIVARGMGWKVVYQVHGGPLPAVFCNGDIVLKAVLRKALSMPDVVVLLAQEELRAYRQFVPKTNQVVIPNAIDESELVSGCTSKSFSGLMRLLYLGRIVRTKGVFETVEAVRLLLSEGHDISLTIAGAGPDEHELRRTIRHAGLEARISLTAPVFGKNKGALLREAHIFSFPTYHPEGLPYALLECMAAGVVPVTTRVGAISDAIAHGQHGIFVRPHDPRGLADAIAALDTDRQTLASMASAASHRVSSLYAVERLARDFEGLYMDLIARRERE